MACTCRGRSANLQARPDLQVKEGHVSLTKDEEKGVIVNRVRLAYPDLTA